MFILIIIDIILSCEAVSRRNARDKGVAPQNRFEQFMDKHYTDEFLDKVYANAVATSWWCREASTVADNPFAA